MVAEPTRPTPLVEIASDRIGASVDLGRVDLDRDMLRAYAQRSGDEAALRGSCEVAPVTFSLTLLSLRRHGPDEARIAAGAFAVHGGHEIEQIAALRAASSYVVRTAITDVFEKSGRSGALAVVERRTIIENVATQRPAAIIREQQIVRWASGEPASHRAKPRGEVTPVSALAAVSLDVGDTLGREVRRAPTRQEIVAWAGHLGEREVLFTDPAAARSRGYADLVVPGPMLSAFAAQMLARALPGWEIRSLAMTFRQSLLAEDGIAIAAVVTARDDESTVECDIVIEDAGGGEICATGAARLVTGD